MVSDSLKSLEIILEDAVNAFMASPRLSLSASPTPSEITALISDLENERNKILAIKRAAGSLVDASDEVDKSTPLINDALSLMDGASNNCQADAFQGMSFYDGTSYGSIRVFEDRVELLADELLSFGLDGTIPHTFRVCGQGNDVKLYVDGQLAIDGTGKFTRPTNVRQIEFGSIASKGNDLSSSWESFRYTVDGQKAPADVGDMILTEAVSLPDGSIGKMESYGDALYVTLDPNDPGISSSIYRHEEGQEDEHSTVLAITRSNITSVVIDPSRNGNIFGTTGKFIGTDRGLQYVLGSKPAFDSSTSMSRLPNEADAGWQLENNCDGNSASIFGGVLTIDTRSEVGTKFWRYAQRRRVDQWVSKANNDAGWTIEARARIGDDGSATFFEKPEDSDPTSPYGARDVVIVVAAGATMADDAKIDFAKRAAGLILLQLRRQDRFAIVSFGDSAASFDGQLLEATQDNVAAAMGFVSGITASGGADMQGGLSAALSYPMTAPSKIVVLISDGKTDSNPSTLLSTVKADNLAGPQADICVLGLSGTVMAEFPVYKHMLDQLSAQNNGITTYLLAGDIFDDKVVLFWRGAGGPVYDFEPAGAGAAGTVTQETAFSASQDRTCEPASAGADPDRRGLAMPEDDGLNAPGIVINDGTYQEVVQFFRNGIRLKYAKLFAPLDMSGRFQTVRVIGKGNAIAVYSKADDEPTFRRLIVAPGGLFVRSFEVSSQERPAVMTDGMGFTHTVWQDVQGKEWKCLYSKTVADEIVDKGSGASGAGTTVGTDVVRARAALGLSPTARADLEGLPDRILVCATASWATKGVKVGDKVALSGSTTPVVCRVQEIIDEWILVVDGISSTAAFQGADYVIFRGEAWTPPVIVSPQQGDSNNPSMGMFSDGNAYVAYDNDETGQKEIYVTRLAFDPSYVSVKESVKVTNTPGRSSRPRMTEASPAGSITVAWEEKSGPNTHVLVAAVPLGDFGSGAATCYGATDMTPESKNARHPALAAGGVIDGSDCSSDFVLIYEDDALGQFDIYAKQVGPFSVVRSTVMLSSGTGDSVNPAIGGRDASYGRIIVAWENDSTGSKEIYSAIATCSPTTSGTSEQQAVASLGFSAAVRVTSSKGDSKNPSVAISGSGDVTILFESDRRRAGCSDLYMARLRPTLGWLSSGQGKLDVRVESYTAASVPSAAYSSDGSLIVLFETSKDGAPSRIARLFMDDDAITIDQSVAGYFPLDDNDGSTIVRNRVGGAGTAVGASRDVILIIQASSSMAADNKLVDAKSMAGSILGLLDAGDNFNVMTFDSASSAWSTSLVANSPANVAAAISFLSGASASGTANIGLGLQAALGMLVSDDVRSKVVILMSDGLPTAGQTATGLLAANVRAANQSAKARIFCVGLGSSPNATLLDSLAGDSDGIALYFAQGSDTAAMAGSVANVALSGSSKLPEVNGLASGATNGLHSAPPNVGASLFSAEDQGAFDLLENGRAFKVDRILVGETGAVDFVMRPHWPSTDATERVLFGSGPLDTTSANTMSLGMTTAGKMRFRVMDGNGFLHQTEVDQPNFQWAAEDVVNLRASWDPEAIGFSTIADVFMLDATTGLACGGGGRIFRTTDGAATWSVIKTPTKYDLLSLDFVSSTLGFASGELGTILVTTDAGLSWSAMDTGLDEDLNSVYFRTTMIGYAVGSDGLVARTADGGTTWSKVDVGSTTDFNDVALLRQGITEAVVAVGAGGQIYRSIDDGISYVQVSPAFAEAPASSRYLAITKTHQAGDYSTYVAGALGVVLRTTDAGASWDSIVIDYGQGYLPNLHAISHGPDSDYVYFVGANGLLGHSFDGGDAWQLCATSIQNGPLTAIDANIAGAGSNLEFFAGGVAGSFIRSADGGENQTYSVVRSGNLSIQINGKEPDQDRTGDLPFTWSPSGNDLYFGDYRFAGDRTANAEFDELYVYRDAYPTTGQSLRRRDIYTLQTDSPSLVHDSIDEKRLEWGNVSDMAKASSYWSSMKLFTCGAIEPLWIFAWNTQLGLVDDVVRDLSVGPDGRLWIATENGISSFDAPGASEDIENWLQGITPTKNPKDRFVNFGGAHDGFPSGSTSSITVDNTGNVWVGTDSGLVILPLAAGNTESGGTTFSDSGIDPIEQERQQVETDVGFNVNSPAISRIITIDDGLPSNKILTVESIGINVFVGTDKGLAIVAYDTAGALNVRIFTVKDGLPSNLVRAIQESWAGDIWIGTDRGVAKFLPDGSLKYTVANGMPSNDVYSIFMDGDDNKYVGTGFGLARISGATVTPFLPGSGLGVGAIQSGVVDSVGIKWMATSLGLVSMDDMCPTGTKFARYSFEDGLLGDGRIRDFQFYRMLGGEIPSGGCEKALVSVIVNGELLAGGYEVMPKVGHSPMIAFDEPLQASDRVDVFVRRNWRKVFDFTGDFRNKGSLAAIEMPAATMFLRRKRFRAGTITLGGNLAKGAGNPSAKMYAAFVAPISGTGPVITSVTRPSGAMAALNAGKGSKPYLDSEDAIEVIASDVLGAEFIKLFSADNEDQSAEYLEFTTSADSIVYVAYDARAGDQLPSWLRGFEAVKATYRITDMTTFTDASEAEKLFMSVSGTTGCVYDLLGAGDICDISDSIAMDTTGPAGCAKIARTNSATNISLSISASDAITGVDKMQVSHRSDFLGAEWVPFSATYNLQLPPGSTNVSTIVPEVVPAGGPTPPPPGFKTNTFFTYNDQVLITSSSPGRVYVLDRATNQATLLFDTGEDEVLSLIQFGSVLLVGTGTDGKVFKWDGTALTQLTLAAGESVTAMAVFDTTAFFGTSPSGRIYAMDDAFVVSLFKDTLETAVTGFAIFGGRLFWTTANDQVSEGDVLFSTTKAGHKHSFVVQAGASRLPDLSGTTSVADGHDHAVVDGVIQPANGHTHVMNGIRPGKVFRYDLAIGLTTIVHADRDYRMNTIASSSLGGNGLLFAGSHPNGKVLRYVPDKNHFIKSFDTTKDTISKLKLIDDKMYAIAGDDVFFFDGRRWQFVAGTGEELNDITSSGGQVVLLGDNKVLATKTSAGQAPIGTNQVCAFVRFRDVAGNVTVIRDADGNVAECYNPCRTLGGGSAGGATGDTSGTDAGTGAGEDPAKALVHRLVEIDENASVTFAMDGDEAFLSGDKVEQEVGVYLSEPFNGTNSLVQWVSLGWDATIQSGSSMTFAVRSASTLSGIADAPWSSEFSTSGVDITNQRGQYLQFRATMRVFQSGVQSPELRKVDIELRTSRAVHYFTTNFVLPDDLRRGILTYNGCINPPVTDVVFGINANDTTEFSDYLVISPNKVFEVTPEHQRKALRVGIKLISSPTSVPVVDEFALLFSLANDAIIRLNLAGTPVETTVPPTIGSTRTVITEKVQGHEHSITFDSAITDKFEINGTTSINAGHAHSIINGVLQVAAGHAHSFSL